MKHTNNPNSMPVYGKVKHYAFIILAIVMTMGVLTGFSYPNASTNTGGIQLPEPNCPYAGPCDPSPLPWPAPGCPVAGPCNPDPFPPHQPIPMYKVNTAAMSYTAIAVPVAGTNWLFSTREWGDEEHVACILDCNFDYPTGSLDQNICFQRCNRRVNYPLP